MLISEQFSPHDEAFSIYNVIGHSKRSSTSSIQHFRRKHCGSVPTGVINSTASAFGLPLQRREFTQMIKRACCQGRPTRLVFSSFNTILNTLTAPASAILSTLTSQAWQPLVSTCKNSTLSQLQKIQIGRLVLFQGNESKAKNVFGADKEGVPVAYLHVHDDKFWVRLALFADMGFAEGHMLGEVSSPDLTKFIELFILNRNHLGNGSNLTAAISSGLAGLVRGCNDLKNAKLNIMAHYDISNEMFAAFLLPDMTYSSPIWLPKSDPKFSGESLYDAQMRKLDRFAVRAVQQTGCRVTSLTLSIEQKDLAEERIREVGMSDKITILLCDYRSIEVPETGAFDKTVSIEMLEAVGQAYLKTYFQCVDKLLKEGGIACFQCITMPDGRYEAYAKPEDFIRRYIFPGGYLPAVSELVLSIQSASGGSLVVDSIENIGPHYSKALRSWREELLNNWDGRIKPQLIKEKQGELDDEGAEIFKRKWDYYFRYSEAGFSTKTLGDVIITVGRESATQMMEDVPL
ncbi:CMAS-domain-containing protein [Macroventuria anomochaeta]|uniref:CMAS-domain-containing protein n=1 Tax=Macroventuria anomochaeta TaxID=301207 RepID=A0ACB6SAL2_9PLEO|nr:CMAS-domain-containing protein [Macroventuria anomochaeta]KAF2631261.1 CMAS-domain-containing protein [Macroventuria anomochaeta]